MKRLVLALAMLLSFNAAFAAKACEELKSEIAAKVDAAGVKGYTLEIVDNDKVADAKVVGSCDGGTKKIVYTKKPAQ
jgi:predicted lipoprotein with Yx(FWY)xxD motif